MGICSSSTVRKASLAVTVPQGWAAYGTEIRRVSEIAAIEAAAEEKRMRRASLSLLHQASAAAAAAIPPTPTTNGSSTAASPTFDAEEKTGFSPVLKKRTFKQAAELIEDQQLEKQLSRELASEQFLGLVRSAVEENSKVVAELMAELACELTEQELLDIEKEVGREIAAEHAASGLPSKHSAELRREEAKVRALHQKLRVRLAKKAPGGTLSAADDERLRAKEAASVERVRGEMTKQHSQHILGASVAECSSRNLTAQAAAEAAAVAAAAGAAAEGGADTPAAASEQTHAERSAAMHAMHEQHSKHLVDGQAQAHAQTHDRTLKRLAASKKAVSEKQVAPQ